MTCRCSPISVIFFFFIVKFFGTFQLHVRIPHVIFYTPDFCWISRLFPTWTNCWLTIYVADKYVQYSSRPLKKFESVFYICFKVSTAFYARISGVILIASLMYCSKKVRNSGKNTTRLYSGNVTFYQNWTTYLSSHKGYCVARREIMSRQSNNGTFDKVVYFLRKNISLLHQVYNL